MSSGSEQENFPPPTVGALMRLAWLGFREQIYRKVREAGYTDLQPAHVLLFRYPTLADMRPSDLAEQMGISKQGINDLLRQLEAKGYVVLRPDPSDGRAKLITLTDRGSDLDQITRSAARQVAEEWARAVGQERFDAFRMTLMKLVQADGAKASVLQEQQKA
jgi:DNA-binding MarR family transcriptional regulator